MNIFLKINFIYDGEYIGSAFYSEIVDHLHSMKILKDILSGLNIHKNYSHSEISTELKKYYRRTGGSIDTNSKVSNLRILVHIPLTFFKPKGNYVEYHTYPNNYFTDDFYSLINIDLKKNVILFTSKYNSSITLPYYIIKTFRSNDIAPPNQDSIILYLNSFEENGSFVWLFNIDNIDDIICKIRVRDIVRELK